SNCSTRRNGRPPRPPPASCRRPSRRRPRTSPPPARRRRHRNPERPSRRAVPRGSRPEPPRGRHFFGRTPMRYATIVLALAGGLVLGAAGRAHGGGKTEFFNGKNLEGWEGLTEYWSVKDGALVGSTYPGGLKFNTFLCSKKKYGDFELKFQIRLKGGKGNSGVQVRSAISNPRTFAVRGPQADIGEGYWGSLWGEDVGGMMKKAPADEGNKLLKKDD